MAANREKAFLTWLQSAPTSEQTLRAVAIGLEEKCFQDMLLKNAAATRRLFTANWEGLDGGMVRECVSDPPWLSLDCWIFRSALPPNPDAMGQCDSENRTIWINPSVQSDMIESLATLLHEMLHAYESQLGAPLLEWLTIELYTRMLKRIRRPRLHRMIDASTHYMVHNAAHGVLFLLKSLDIDLRFRWPIGTTFGYGRADMLQDASRRRRGGDSK